MCAASSTTPTSTRCATWRSWVVAAVPEADRTAGVALFAGRFDTAALGAGRLDVRAPFWVVATVPAQALQRAATGERRRP